jgi:hypothetical protein
VPSRPFRGLSIEFFLGGRCRNLTSGDYLSNSIDDMPIFIGKLDHVALPTTVTLNRVTATVGGLECDHRNRKKADEYDRKH